MLRKIITVKCVWHQICTKMSLWRQMLRNIITWKWMWHHIYIQNLWLLKANAQGNCYLKMHLTPHMYKIIILKANAKEIITCKMHLTPHIYKIITLIGKCQENCYLNMCLTANMYKIVSVKANAQGNHAAVKCICHQICTKMLLWRQMLRNIVTWNCFWHAIYVYKIITLQGYPWFFPSCDLCICKCSPWEFSDKCDQVLYYCSFLHFQCSHSCTLKDTSLQ